MQILTEKVKYLIFLEEHTAYFRLKKIIPFHLDLEERLAVLTETSPYSKQTLVLEEYANALRNKKRVRKKDFFKEVENTKNYYKYCFQRQMDLIEYAIKEQVQFKVIPVDVRDSKKWYKQFKKEDVFFKELLKNSPKVDEFKFKCFEEHAFGAWYTLKKINELEKEGFKSFIYSVGYGHHAALEHYLFKKEKPVKFAFLKTNNFGVHYYRLCSFFIEQFRRRYCMHCGKEHYGF